MLPKAYLLPVLVGPRCRSWVKASWHCGCRRRTLYVFLTSDVSLELVIFISLAASAFGPVLG